MDGGRIAVYCAVMASSTSIDRLAGSVRHNENRSLRFLAVLILAFIAAGLPVFAQEGTAAGTVVDTSGASIAHVQVKLSVEGRGTDQETKSAENGDFSFLNVAPGRYQLSFSAKDFAAKTITVDLPSGETVDLPPTVLSVATLNAGVNVSDNQAEIAEAEIKVQEQQRIFGLVPNYFVTYNPDAAPLNAKQKFELTWKNFFDPAAFVITGMIAGASQAQNRYPGFGQGAQGYAKRYGATYLNYVTSSLMERVVMPTIFKQDPRYFYKGTGRTRSRAFYAISRAVICKGDNKQDQFCYSSVISHFASSAITNYYYPAVDRNSAGVTVENAAIGIAAKAIGNLVQEFIARKLTPDKP
jgi:Carboxypeptidase regulatory-like domain